MLELYKNIRTRRMELRLTQTDLAKMLGYSDKSAISRIEKGEIDLPQSKIYAFAKALRIEPAQLTGWDIENPTPQERELMDLFHALDEKGQAVAIQMLKNWVQYVNGGGEAK